MNNFVPGKEEIHNLLPWLRQDLRRSKYPCPNSNCKSIFSTYHNLKSHVINHCGKPPRFKCAHCDYQTTWRKDVKRHAVNIHRDAITPVVELYKVNKEERYYCQNLNCTEFFSFKRSLLSHMRKYCSYRK